MSDMQRFTVYRHNMDSRETHSAMHKNPGDVPQYEV
jgi:hypothetical protein